MNVTDQFPLQFSHSFCQSGNYNLNPFESVVFFTCVSPYSYVKDQDSLKQRAKNQTIKKRTFMSIKKVLFLIFWLDIITKPIKNQTFLIKIILASKNETGRDIISKMKLCQSIFYFFSTARFSLSNLH